MSQRPAAIRVRSAVDATIQRIEDEIGSIDPAILNAGTHQAMG